MWECLSERECARATKRECECEQVWVSEGDEVCVSEWVFELMSASVWVGARATKWVWGSVWVSECEHLSEWECLSANVRVRGRRRECEGVRECLCELLRVFECKCECLSASESERVFVWVIESVWVWASLSGSVWVWVSEGVFVLEGVRVCECEWEFEWECMSEWVNECERECLSESVRATKWVSVCVWGSVSARVFVWVSVWVNECEWDCEWVSARATKRVRGRRRECLSERECEGDEVSECLSESESVRLWVRVMKRVSESVWVNECVGARLWGSVWVCEWERVQVWVSVSKFEC
jgi:hypothetical protein